MRIGPIALLLTAICSAGYAQSDDGWLKAVVHGTFYSPAAITETSDGGFAVTIEGDLLVARFNRDRTPQWSVKLRQEETSFRARAIRETRSGSLVVLASSVVVDPYARTMVWIITVSSSGKIIGQTRIDADDHLEPFAMELTRDQGIVIAGQYANQSSFLIKLDGTGALKWQRLYDLTDIDEFLAVKEVRDGGLILGGYGLRTGWIVKTNAAGDVVWQRTYEGEGGGATFSSIVEAGDGGYVAAGRWRPFNGGDRDVWVMKVDKRGNPTWQMALRGSNDDRAHHVIKTRSGYVVGAVTNSFGAGEQDVWILRLSDRGELTSQTTIGSADTDLTGVDPILPMSGTADRGVLLAFGSESWRDRFPVIRVGQSQVIPQMCQLAASSDAQAYRTETRPVDTKAQISRASFTVNAANLQSSESRLKVADLCSSSPEQTAIPRGTKAKQPAQSLPTIQELIHPGAREDSELSQMAALFRKGQFAQLESYFSEARGSEDRNKILKGELKSFYISLAQSRAELADLKPAAYLGLIDRWEKAYPRSVTPRLLRAQLHVDLGAAARGIGMGDTVTGAAAVQTKKQFELARQTLDSIPEDLRDPFYYTTEMIVRAFSGMDLQPVFDEGRSRYPDHWDLYFTYIHFRQRVWGGGIEEMAEVARQGGEAGGDLLYALLAVWVFSHDGARPFQSGLLSWPQAKEGILQLRNQSPGTEANFHWYGRIAHAIGDRAFARQLFTLPELNWRDDLVAIWTSKKKYDDARKWALAESPAAQDSPGR